jgi:Na+-driven multidrug efflux pump
VLNWGVKGAAGATVFSQFVSGIGIGLYTLKKFPQLCPKKADCRWDKKNLDIILNLSVMTSVQQSIMNFGILMVQGLVNSFGTVIMAAVKIDSFAYMPVQDFGNAFSTYVAQNYGAGQTDRIKKGIRSAGLCSAVFCVCISVLVCAFAAPLMSIFIDPGEGAIIAAGVHYLRIEGACYIGIGILFLLYGYYRAVNQPQMSVVLTIASLGTRVALAYLLSATPLGVTGIWLGAGRCHWHWILPEKEALKKQIAQKQKPGTFLSRLARNRFRVPTFARC